MGKVVKRIVLTGGPCAGKSSSLDFIKNYYSAKGYLVYVVNESATELINSGIIPVKNELSMFDFQEVILKYQLYKENLIEDVATRSLSDKEIIIIFDRGVFDNKAYIDKKDFEFLLEKYNLNEFDLLNRYDLVIHLETGAKSKFYTIENNKARYESIEEAIEKDNKTFDAWKLHNNVVRIKCYNDFNEKQKEIINVCENNFNKNIKVQYKYVVNKDKFNLDLSWYDYKVEILQYYLEFNDKYEHRLRKLKYNNCIKYNYTIQMKKDNGISCVIFDKFIDEKLFNLLLQTKKIINEISKERFYITYEDVLIHLDIFQNGEIIVESNDKFFDYKKFNIISEVTNDSKYLNINMINLEKVLEYKKYTSLEVI